MVLEASAIYVYVEEEEEEKFFPDNIRVIEGETIRFIKTNGHRTRFVKI